MTDTLRTERACAHETSAQRIRSHDVGLDVSESGLLTIDRCDVAGLAERFGTPLWVLSASALRRNLEEITRAFAGRYPGVRIVYASKSNPAPGVLALMASMGALVDVASGGHVALALRAGVRPDHMVVNGNCKTTSELTWAITSGVAALNVDSVQEMQEVARLTAELDGRVRVCLRLATDLARHSSDPGLANSRLEAKFGMNEEQALEAAAVASRAHGVEIVGIHHHLGFTAYDSSYNATLDLQRRRACVAQVIDFAKTLTRELSIQCAILNFGGGFRVQTSGPYGPGGVTSLPAIDDIAEVLTTEALALSRDAGLPDPEIWIEPGGYVSSSAGVFVAKVGVRKPRPETGPDWLFLEETSAYHFVRTIMFNIFHPVLAADRMFQPCTEQFEIAGGTCAPDTIRSSVALPALDRGALVAVLDQGAYCEAIATEFCAMPLPGVVMADNGVAIEVKSRRTAAALAEDYGIAQVLQTTSLTNGPTGIGVAK